VRHHERRGHDLEPEHPFERRFLHVQALERALAFFRERVVDALQNGREIGARAAAGIEDDHVFGGEAVLLAQVFPQRLIDARDHVGHDLVRGVPDAQLAPEFGIERFEKRLVEKLHGVSFVEALEERLALDAVQRRRRPVEQLFEAERFQGFRIGELPKERRDERHVQMPDRFPPIELARGRRFLARPQHPGGEHAVKERLHESRAEKVLAFRALEFHAQGLFERLAHRAERRERPRVLDARQAVARVGGQEPGDVLGLAQGDRMRERALQVFAERPANPFGRRARRIHHGPERIGGGRERELFELRHAPVRPLAHDEEGAQVGRDDQPVRFKVALHLRRAGERANVLLRAFGLDHAALGHLSGTRLAALKLGLRVKPEIGMARARVLKIGEAQHARLQLRANGGEEGRHGGIMRAFLGPGAKAARGAKVREIRLDCPDECVRHAFPRACR